MATLPPELDIAARVLFAFAATPEVPDRVDLIVCLGSYDTRVAGRAAELAEQHPQARLIVTGQAGNWTRGALAGTEAEVFAEVILARGVAPSRLMLEMRATNIGENIALSRALAQEAGWEVGHRR